MARHPQPRELAEIKGATRVHPERYRNEPPKSAVSVGDPPDYLSPLAKQVWHDICALSIKGVLQGPHRFLLEIAATLMAEFREWDRAAKGSFPANQLTQLRGALAQLCLTPGEQQKLGVDKKQEDPFAEFFAGKKPQ